MTGRPSFQKEGLLYLLGAPDELLSGMVVPEGKADQVSAPCLIEHRKQKVVEHALLDCRKIPMHKGFLQEEVNQRGLVVPEPQGPQALQDASEAQVVVSVTAAWR